MKKFLTLALALVLILSLSACGKQETSSGASGAAGQTVSNGTTNETENSANGNESKTQATASEAVSNAVSSKEQSTNTNTPNVTTSKNTTTQNGPIATQSAPSNNNGDMGVTASQVEPPRPSDTTNNERNPLKSLKMGEEYVARLYFEYDDENIYAPGLQFFNDGGYGDGDYYCIMVDAMFTCNPDDDIKDRTPVTYKGKKYYRCGGGQSPAYAELTGKDITITKDGSVIQLQMASNDELIVVKSQVKEYSVGTVFSIKWNMLK